MKKLANLPLLRGIGTLAFVISVLTGGTWLTMKFATDHLLYQEATETARDWAQFIAESVSDLEQIAAGEQPSVASIAFFQATRKTSQVFRWEVFNPEGYSQLAADRNAIALVNLSEFSSEAAQSVRLSHPIVDVKEGQSADLPSFFGQAYVPVIVDGHTIAVVAAYVDQTAARDRFANTFLIAAVSLCIMMALAFATPAVAWYHRTQEKERADRRIRFLAYHDALTGLPNRPCLIEELDKALDVLPLRGGGLAVHFIDVDRFKEVNDTLGHEGGDCLLQITAERLRAAVRMDDVVARLGGDEFVVVQSGVDQKDQAKDLAQRILVELSAPIKYKDHHILATVSMGVAWAATDGQTPERLLKSADLALYRAKADGRNCIRFFLPEMDSELSDRIKLERTLREAVLHDRFELHYQPLFELAGRRLIGFEALIRLIAEDGTLIPPMRFIPVAEEMRLIDKVGAWVLREACRAAATWPEHLTVAVNLSPAQFAAGSVSNIVADALREAGLAPHRLELEITETLLLGNSEAIMAELQTLKAMGVAIVMDDFGTGYSSLSYLWRFPFDKIKIDRSFMQAFDGSGRDAETVVKTIIALGRELHIRVTVEGVETVEQAAFLDSADGDQAQGFFFGRPVHSSDVSASILADFQKSLPATAEETKLRVVKSSAA
jgi:diguanylate cyclase (GGDEF)-like protein